MDLARKPGASVAQVAKDLGISESGLRRWLAQDDIDTGRREGLSTSEREELTRLRLASGEVALLYLLPSKLGFAIPPNFAWY